MSNQFSTAGLSSINQLNQINNILMQSMMRVSSGSKINSASDDPSGYYSSKTLERDIKVAEVEERNMERERNAINSQNTILDSASNIVSEMEALSQSASGVAVSDQEKAAIQQQVDELYSHLDQSLQNAGLGSAKDYGIEATDLKITGSEDALQNSISKIRSSYDNLLSANVSKGSEYNQKTIALQNLGPAIINLKSSLSTIKDADIATESMKINNYKILQNLSVQGVKNSQDVQKSALNLFG
ncbi:MAG: hypothetical protein ACD_79C00650G0013 [uncultured bacterium]|nr:MAG: hypothetical protein ACD_79C00650G0013 [uncultured bacterium]